MTDQLRIDGVEVAPGVLETIVALAADKVDGVAALEGGPAIKGLVHKGGARGVTVTVADDGVLGAAVHILVAYGNPLRDVGARLQHAVADALSSQTGQPVGDVEVYIDGIVFDA